MKSKTRKPDQRYGVVALKRSKTGNVVHTSQGDINFTKDIMACKNEEQMLEAVESNPFYFRAVSGERPHEPGSRPTFTVPDLPWKRRNRMDRLDREEEERERAFHEFDQ